MPVIADYLQRMQARILGPEQRVAFATDAIALRWQEKPPVDTEAVLAPRRLLDRGTSLWITYNVIQENLVRGCAGASRAVRSIDGTLQLNARLWELAVGYL